MHPKIQVGSLRLTTKDRLLSLLDSVPGERKLLLLDDWTVKVVDSVCSLHDMLDSGAFLVEVISKRRQPYPTMQAVYFVSPLPESFEIIARDFECQDDSSPQYSEVHILSTGRIGDEQMKRIANSPIVTYIKTLKEVYLDFLAIESRVYTTGSDSRLLRPGYASQSIAIADLDRMARQIAAACVTMGEKPNIRFRQSQHDNLPSKLAEILCDMLEKYYSGNPDFHPSEKSSEVIILNRSFDLVTPLLHEFTYQAMVMDLLASEGKITGGNRYKQGDKVTTLDESDSLWVSLRHVHIAECSAAITKKFRQFLSENKVATQQLQQGKKGEDDGQMETVSLSQLKEVMGALGQFQEQKSQFTMHMDIAEKCFNAMNGKRLMDVALVEQKLACGCDAQGETIGDPWAGVANILGRANNLTSSDKSRLLCLYFACSGQATSDSERKTLIESAKLDKVDADAIRYYLTLLKGHWRPGRGDRKSKHQREEPYEVSRFIPQLQFLAEDAARNSLDTDSFPYIKKPRLTSSTLETLSPHQQQPSTGTSLRAKSAAPAGSSQAIASKTVWFFVIGGATWSEARSIYQVSARTRQEIYLGSTHLVNSESFLRDLLG